MAAQRKAEHVDWKNKLINSKTFCTNYAGEEYSIEEADNPCEHTGECEQQCAGDQGIFQRISRNGIPGKMNVWQVCLRELESFYYM